MLNPRPLDVEVPTGTREGETLELRDNRLLVNLSNLFMLQVPFECRVLFCLGGRNGDKRNAMEGYLTINSVRSNSSASKAIVKDASKPFGVVFAPLLKF